jgi:phosphoribosyl-ATP pyrophosphohydrolase
MEMLKALEDIIHDRRINPQEGSYTNKLMQLGRAKIAQKVGEEGVEVVIAALAEDTEAQKGEIADLLYHLMVLMNDLDIRLEDVNDILKTRHQPTTKDDS